jgi:hypothetical protein
MNMKIRVLLTCPAGASECLAKLQEVLEPIEQVGVAWPTAESWERTLPHWFVSACAKPMSASEAEAYVARWRTMSREEQIEADKGEQWSLPDWLYWMEPKQSVWRWFGAAPTAPDKLEVTLTVEGLPVALGSFEWLARAAGASDVSVRH